MPEGSLIEQTKLVNKSGNKFLKVYCPICANDKFSALSAESGWFLAYKHRLIKGGKSCRCGKTYKWSRVQRELQIKERIEQNSLPYKFLGWESGYDSPESKCLFECELHGSFKMSVNNFVNGKKHCRKCKSLFRNWFYLNEIRSDSTLIGIKFGITKNPKRRLKEQQRSCKFRVEASKLYHFENDEDAVLLEKAILEYFSVMSNAREFIFDGYTEVISGDQYEELLKYVVNFIDINCINVVEFNPNEGV